MNLKYLLLLSVAWRSTFAEDNDVVSQEHIELPVVNAAASPPYFVAYWDSWVSGQNGPPSPSVLKGFNVLNLAFLLASGAADQAIAWQQLSSSQRSSAVSKYHAAGIKIMVSALGSTDAPTSSGYDPVTLATSMAKWVKKYDLDGIDVDYEDFNAINAADGKAEKWLISFTKTLRANLPAGQYLLTHAPVAPWFSPIYTAGAYTKVHQQVGSLIDFYNLQFYNQGTNEYTTCGGLLNSSSQVFPKTALFQIHSTAGVPLSKLVIGKPGGINDADNGYMTTSKIAYCASLAKNRGWTGGVMVWEYPSVATKWITAVRSTSWPVSGSIQALDESHEMPDAAQQKPFNDDTEPPYESALDSDSKQSQTHEVAPETVETSFNRDRYKPLGDAPDFDETLAETAASQQQPHDEL